MVSVYEMVKRQLFSIEKIEKIQIPPFTFKDKKSNFACVLGNVYLDLMGEEGFASALEKFNLAINEDPQNPYPYNAMGQVLYFQGAGKEAITAEKEGDAEKMSYYRNKVSESVSMYKKALDLIPDNPWCYSNILLPMSKLSYPIDEILQYGERTISLCKKDNRFKSSLMFVYNNIGMLYGRRGIYNFAEKYFRLSNMVRKNSLALRDLGMLYYKQENYRKANYYFREALKLDPKDSTELEYRIYSLKMLNKNEDAKRLLADFEKSEPDLSRKMKELFRSPNWRHRLRLS